MARSDRRLSDRARFAVATGALLPVFGAVAYWVDLALAVGMVSVGIALGWMGAKRTGADGGFAAVVVLNVMALALIGLLSLLELP